jgi:hypothetical protein
VVDYNYPTAVQLEMINQELVPRLEAARPIFQIMPTRNVDHHLLEWEQRDNYKGLQQVRGLNGAPTRVKAIGGKRYQMQPGVYGEFELIDEAQLTQRRAWGSLTNNIDIADLVREKQEILLGRRLDRIEYIGWTLLVTGTFAIAQGASVLHTDSFTTQTYGASVPWATTATSTPIADLRAVQLLSRGASLDFGGRATIWMNRATMNSLLSNTNAADLGGRRGAGLVPINSMQQINDYLGMEDLPALRVYDQGYIDDNGTFHNNRAVLVGVRTDGDPIMEYRYTRNANNADLGPGPYMRVIDDPDEVPRSIQVHDGHNGGPVIFHPQAVVVLTV